MEFWLKKSVWQERQKELGLVPSQLAAVSRFVAKRRQSRLPGPSRDHGCTTPAPPPPPRATFVARRVSSKGGDHLMDNASCCGTFVYLLPALRPRLHQACRSSFRRRTAFATGCCRPTSPSRRGPRRARTRWNPSRPRLRPPRPCRVAAELGAFGGWAPRGGPQQACWRRAGSALETQRATPALGAESTFAPAWMGGQVPALYPGLRPGRCKIGEFAPPGAQSGAWFHDPRPAPPAPSASGVLRRPGVLEGGDHLMENPSCCVNL